MTTNVADQTTDHLSTDHVIAGQVTAGPVTARVPRRSRPVGVAAVRWPYRVVAVESPSRPLTQAGHEALLDHGIDLQPYADGPSALLGLVAEDPGAVLAPTDLIGVDFLRFVQAVTAWTDIPVIIGLSPDPTSHDYAFQALEAGGRGLLALPFQPDQLASAIKHVGLTRTAPATTLRYGAVELDRSAHQVRVSGTLVGLSAREFSLLEHLLAEAPRIVPVDEIASVIGEEPNPAGAPRVRNYVKRLRRRLAATQPERPVVIESIRGLGYRIAEQ